MPFDLKSWIGQSTTGQGFTVLASTLLALLTHTVDIATAIPALLGAAVLIVWPQKTDLSLKVQSVAADVVKAAPPLIADVQQLLAFYEAGHAKGAATSAIVVSSPATAPTPVATVTTTPITATPPGYTPAGTIA